MLTVDGSQGEGGGQVLRTALSLSGLTGQAFEIERIRARRKAPGLMHQHLTSVQAAARVCNAHVEGAALGSQRLRFTPGPVSPGLHHFAVGTAGSALLVVQTVLPLLLCAAGPSRVRVEGGTHNPLAPPFDFLERSFLAVLNRMGPRVSARLERYGFYPAGGGAVEIDVEPASRLQPLDLARPPTVRRLSASALVARLPRAVAERELAALRAELDLGADAAHVVEAAPAGGPGNALFVELALDTHHEVFTAFGQRGRPAAAVAADVVRQVREYLEDAQPVGHHLADQLLIPFAMAGAGEFWTGPPSQHTLTNVDVVRRFLPVPIECRPSGARAWTVAIGS